MVRVSLTVSPGEGLAVAPSVHAGAGHFPGRGRPERKHCRARGRPVRSPDLYTGTVRAASCHLLTHTGFQTPSSLFIRVHVFPVDIMQTQFAAQHQRHLTLNTDSLTVTLSCVSVYLFRLLSGF